MFLPAGRSVSGETSTRKAAAMLDFLIAEPGETMLRTLADALNSVDIGIILLNPEMRVRFINDRQIDLLRVSSDLLATGPQYRELVAFAVSKAWFAAPLHQTADFIAQQEHAVLAGPIPPTRIDLMDGRRLLFACKPCSDGGRILTYVDISEELEREAQAAVAHVSAEMRFRTETLEDQGAHLASLAEAVDESARKVELAVLELESEIVERRKLEVELRRLATEDGLTGILNRSAFMAAGQREMEHMQQFDQTLVVLMFDVDHFKAINDRYGHEGGDLALRHLSSLLRSDLRDGDLLGRLGGEEFAIVLPGASLDVAGTIAERLRSCVEASRLAFGEHVIGMTISVGLAVRQATDRTIEPIIARADAALYRAKRAGRNRVERNLAMVPA
jgi:diguanylate cyclase (GGDEF)-like protein